MAPYDLHCRELDGIIRVDPEALAGNKLICDLDAFLERMGVAQPLLK
jgi:hypothetical protein